jgi:hypothetical protein
MKWEVVKRNDMELMLMAVQTLHAGEVVVVTSNGTKNLEKTRALICFHARKRGIAVTTKKIDNDHLEVTRSQP